MAEKEEGGKARACDGASQASARAELVARVERLKAERDAVILAHYYVAPEVQAIADYVGDSFFLARRAAALENETLVVCGVSFMGEAVKLLNPARTVLLPDPRADCPMAHMVRRETIDQARRAYGDDVAVVCYVNSTAEAKSWSDVCVTSSNAVKIVSELPQRHVLFIPDRNLGRYVAQQVSGKTIVLNDGCCPRHEAISLSELLDLKAEHPEALVLAHPECTKEVLAEADFIGSTAEIIAFAERSDTTEFIIVTVRGVLYELRRRCGEAKRFYFTRTPPTCPDMDLITLEAVASCLRTGAGEVALPAPQIADGARAALERMLEFAAR